MTRSMIAGLFFAVTAALFPMSGKAQGTCGPFPQVSWWGPSSHAREMRTVERRFGGNWPAYVARWEERLMRLEEIRTRKNTAIVGSRQLRLSGRALDGFIDTVRRRISVTRCLADETLAGMVTAAGSSSSNVKGLPGLDVSARCRPGMAVFQVRNTGKEWTRVADFSVLVGSDPEPVSNRRMRLTQGQKATFKINLGESARGAAVLSIDPSWKRGSVPVARIDCTRMRTASRPVDKS